jgi:YVTN family beta-propeller protein
MKTKPFVLLGALLAATALVDAATVRIVQTNAAGDSVMLIDPATNKVVGEIKDIEVNHGAAVAPDGSRFYITNEAESTVDIVDAKSLKILKKVPLTNHPNNISVSKDGKRVYAAIVAGAGAIDVIDAATMTRVKSIRTEGGIHNTYVTPDGKFVIGGSIPGRKITVIDQKTEEILYTIPTDAGVRPICFETNPDGSTKRMFVQLSDFHGFVAIDWNTKQVTERIKLPDVPEKERHTEGLQGSPSHGIGIHARRQNPVGHQQNEQLDLRVFDSRPEVHRRRESRRSPGLADLHARQQVRLRRERWIEFSVGSRQLRAQRNDADQGRPGAEAEHHRGPSLIGRQSAVRSACSSRRR